MPPPDTACTRRAFFARTSEGEELCASEFLPDGITLPNCLVLHGAGAACQRRVEPLCRALASRGFAPLSFDFSGHGLSSGSIAASSIRKKVDEALGVTRWLDPLSPLSVCAFSMAGEVALRLLPQMNQRVENLILFAPAIYDVAAYDVPFGPEFSNIIRAAGSWRRSDAPALLRGFKGQLLIVIGDHDEVIPPEVIEILCSAATAAARVRVLRLRDAPHQLGIWMTQNPLLTKQLADRIVDLVARPFRGSDQSIPDGC